MQQSNSLFYRLLRASEKYTRTDMVYLAKGGFWLTVGYAVAFISGLGLTAAMANLISPEVYGTYKFVLAMAAVVGAFTLTGLQTAIIRSVAKGFEGTFTAGYKLLLRWNLLVTVAAALVSLYYFKQNNTELAIAMLIVGCFSPLMTSGQLSQAFLAGKEKFRAQTFNASIKTILSAVAMIGTILVTDNFLYIIFMYFFSKAVLEQFFYFYTVCHYHPNTEVEESAFGFSKHLSLMNILLIFARQSDKLILFHFLGPVQLAIYSLAIAPVTELKKPEKFLGNLALPKLSKLSIPEIKRTLPRKMLFVFGLCFVLVVLYILSAPYVFYHILPQYTDAIVYSQVFALTLLLTPSLFFNQVLVTHMQTRQLYITRTVIPIIKIFFLLVCVPVYGLWGAVGVMIGNHVVQAAIQTYYFYRL